MYHKNPCYTVDIFKERKGDFMKRKKCILLVVGVMLIGCMTGCGVMANAQAKNVNQQQALSASTGGNVELGSSTAELPGGNVDYAIYEPYGLLYDNERDCYTYNESIVRFFNDPIAGASVTNFFTGTVDIEAERDKDNNLIGIKECSQDVYDWHTQKHNNSGLKDMSPDMSMQTGGSSEECLKDYEDYGVSYDKQNGCWNYNDQRIKVLVDSGNAVYNDDRSGICLAVLRNSNNQIEEVKIISEADAQILLQNNTPNSGNLTTEE